MTKELDVICIGAALVDMVAQVERHPQDDDEVFVSDLNLMSGGAAANTAYACAKLGLKTAFIGKLGTDDDFGRKIIRDFKEMSLDTSLIKYSKNFRTGSAYVVLSKNGERRIYAHSGAANYLNKNDIISDEIIGTKILFLSSLKNLDSFVEAAKIARDNNIIVILNPGMLIIEQGLEKIKHLLKKIDIFILSQREFKNLLSLEDVNFKDINGNMKTSELFNLGIKVVIITTGKNGAILINQQKSEKICAIEVEDIVDTTGAGDAFSAGFIYGFVKNLSFKFDDLKKDVMLGNFVAGKCIQKLGARNGIPNSDEIMHFF